VPKKAKSQPAEGVFDRTLPNREVEFGESVPGRFANTAARGSLGSEIAIRNSASQIELDSPITAKMHWRQISMSDHPIEVPLAVSLDPRNPPPLFHRVWPSALLILASALTVAWIGFLGFEFVGLVGRAL